MQLLTAVVLAAVAAQAAVSDDAGARASTEVAGVEIEATVEPSAAVVVVEALYEFVSGAGAGIDLQLIGFPKGTLEELEAFELVDDESRPVAVLASGSTRAPGHRLHLLVAPSAGAHRRLLLRYSVVGDAERGAVRLPIPVPTDRPTDGGGVVFRSRVRAPAASAVSQRFPTGSSRRVSSHGVAEVSTALPAVPSRLALQWTSTGSRWGLTVEGAAELMTVAVLLALATYGLWRLTRRPA